MPKLDKSYWTSKKEVSLASMQGFSVIDSLPRLLQEAYPHLRDFVFGFFTKEDVPSRLMDGWMHVTRDDIPDWESYNEAMPLRFGITDDANGYLRCKEYYIMAMEKDYRKRQLRKREEYDDKRYYGSVRSPGNMQTNPDIVVSDVTYEERVVSRGGDAETHGRRRKNK